MVTVGQRSERVKRFLRLWVRPVVRLLFRPEVHGVENLPARGPYMLVANHSAGMGLAEIACIAGLLGPFMGDRPMAAFVHPINYTNSVTTWIQDGLGSIPSTYDAADEALKSGVALLVFPGGDHETLRPFWQANRVDFGGRRGFLRIAKRSQVAVVPMGIRGSHWTAPMLFRARWLAWVLVAPRLMGQKRWGVSLLACLGAISMLFLAIPMGAKLFLAWFWLASPLGFLPVFPATIRMKIGQPIPPGTLFVDTDPELTTAQHRVQHAVQLLVDSLQKPSSTKESRSRVVLR